MYALCGTTSWLVGRGHRVVGGNRRSWCWWLSSEGNDARRGCGWSRGRDAEYRPGAATAGGRALGQAPGDSVLGPPQPRQPPSRDSESYSQLSRRRTRCPPLSTTATPAPEWPTSPSPVSPSPRPSPPGRRPPARARTLGAPPSRLQALLPDRLRPPLPLAHRSPHSSRVPTRTLPSARRIPHARPPAPPSIR